MRNRLFQFASCAAALTLAAPAAAETPVESKPVVDPIDMAAQGLAPAQIEDDAGQRDLDLVAVRTAGCVTVLHAEDGVEFRIDWSQPARGVFAEGFVFIKAPPVQLAIVGDVDEAEQLDKLTRLGQAMEAKAKQCGGWAALTE